MGNGTLVVGKNEVEHHQIDFLDFFVKRSGVGCGQQTFNTGDGAQHFGICRAQHQKFVTFGAHANVVADDGATLGVAQFERLFSKATFSGFVFDLDAFCHHFKRHRLAAIQVIISIGWVTRLHIHILHITIGVGHAKRHVLGTAHQNTRHAR